MGKSLLEKIQEIELEVIITPTTEKFKKNGE